MDVPYYIDKADSLHRISDDDRQDINANAAPTYLRADEFSEIESDNNVNGPSNDSQAPADGQLREIKPEVKSYSGNYVENNDGDGEVTSRSYALTAGGSTGETTEKTDEDKAAEAVDNVSQAIEDEQFIIDHGGLSRQEFDQLLADLRAAGLGDIADILAANPEYASTVLDWISDPEGYWDGLRSQAQTESDARKSVLQRLGFWVEGDDLEIEPDDDTYEEYTDANGVHWAHYHFDDAGDVDDIYVDDQGNVYVYDDGELVRQTTVDQLVKEGVLSQAEADALKGFKSVDERVAELHHENMVSVGLPDSWDPRNVSETGRAAANKWKDKTWIKQDGDYLNIDPRFYEEMKKLLDLYNLLALLALLMQAKSNLKRIVAEITGETKLEESKFSPLEAIETKRSNATALVKQRLYILQNYVSNHNNRVLQQKMRDAQKAAYDEARSGWDGFWNYFLNIISFGGSDTLDRDTQYKAAKKQEKINQDYSDFQRRVEGDYEKVLGKKIDYDSGDPFGAEIDRLMAELEISGLTEDVGGGKKDISRDKIPDLRNRLVSLENARKLWYLLNLAVAKLKTIVAEITSGRDLRIDGEGLVMGSLSDLVRLEEDAAANIINQVQGALRSGNDAIDAGREASYQRGRWWSGALTAKLGPLSYLGRQVGDAIVDAIDYGRDDESDLEKSDLHLDYEKILRDVQKDRENYTRKLLTSDERAARALDLADKEQMLLIAKLDGEGVVKKGKDDIWVKNEKEINRLRDQLTASQNFQRLLIMLARAKNRFREMVGKITTRSALGSSGILDADTFDPIFQNRLLALELKKSSLDLQIKEHNKEAMQSRRLEQSLWRAGGLTVGAIIAVILIIVCPPLGVAASIGLVSGLAGLGAAAGNLIFHGLNPVDTETANQVEDFYPQVEKTIVKNNEKRTDEVIDRLVREEKAEVDRLANSNFHIDFGSGQWGINAGAIISLNSTLTRLQLLIKLLYMLEQAKNELRGIISASTTGVSAEGGNDFVRSSNKALEADLRSAVSLKEEMARDIIGAHNRDVLAEKDFNQSLISAVISAASVIAGGIGGAIGGAGSAAGEAGQAAGNGMTAAQGVMKGLEVGGFVNSAVNLGFAIYDRATADNPLENNREINMVIDEIYRVRDGDAQRQLRAAERAAVQSMGNSLVADIGGGKLAVNNAAYYQLKNEIEKIYNVYITLATVTQARSNLLKRVASALGIAAGRENDEAIDAFYAAKERSQQNLETLRQRVQEYAERANQVNDFNRELYLAVAAFTVSLANFTGSSLPNILKDFKITSKMPSFSSKIQELLKEKINALLKEKLGLNKTDIAITDKWGLNKIAEWLLGSEGGAWDGRVGYADLAGVLYKILTSEAFARYVALKIQRESAGNHGRPTPAAAPAKNTRSADSLDNIYQAGIAEEISLGEVETDTERVRNEQELAQEISRLLFEMSREGKNALGWLRSGEAPTGMLKKVGDEVNKQVGEKGEKVESSAKEKVQEKNKEQDKLKTALGIVNNDSPEVARFSRDYDRFKKQLETTKFDDQSMVVSLAASAAVLCRQYTDQPWGKAIPTLLAADFLSATNDPKALATAAAALDAGHGTEGVTPQNLTRVLQKLRALAKVAAECAERGNYDRALVQSSVNLVKAAVKSLVMLLPKAVIEKELGQTLQGLKQKLEGGIGEEELVDLLTSIERMLDELKVNETGKKALKEAIEYLRTVRTRELAQARLRNFYKQLSDPAADIDGIIDSFVNLGDPAKLMVIDRLKQNIETYRALLEMLALDTRLDPKIRLLIKAALQAAPVIKNPPTQMILPVIEPKAVSTAQTEKRETEKIDIKLTKNPETRQVSREAVAAVVWGWGQGQQAKGQVREKEKEKAEVKVEEASLEPAEFNGLAAHNRIIRIDQLKRDETALV